MNEAKKYLDNLLNKNDTIIVATSGGPDSMCLLHLVLSYKNKYNLKIICAHVNHNLRKESEEEKIYVENYAINNNIIFEYKKLDNYKNNKFTESEGRSKRYEFFSELVKKYKAKYLFTAHHGDDLTETILMRIVRGSNIKGYIGIPKLTIGKDYTIVRPLLYLTKEDIYNYLKDNKIKYYIDKSNNDIKYTRNRYRSNIIPSIKKEDNNVHLKFLKFSEALEETNNYINKIINKKMKKIVNNNIINIELLLKEDEYVIKRIVTNVIEDIQKDYIFNINDKQFNNIIKLLNNKSNKQIDLADGFIARRSYNNLIIEKNIINNEYEYELKDKLEINNFQFRILKNTNDNSNYCIRLNSEEIKLPLKIRTKKNGDTMQVKNLNGTKKVKDIFIDSKIDQVKRDSYPILIDSDNKILLIPGIKKSIFSKDINEKYDIIIKCEEK